MVQPIPSFEPSVERCGVWCPYSLLGNNGRINSVVTFKQIIQIRRLESKIRQKTPGPTQKNIYEIFFFGLPKLVCSAVHLALSAGQGHLLWVFNLLKYVIEVSLRHSKKTVGEIHLQGGRGHRSLPSHRTPGGESARSDSLCVSHPRKQNKKR